MTDTRTKRQQRYSLQQKSGPDTWAEISQHRFIDSAGRALERMLPGDRDEARVIDRQPRAGRAERTLDALGDVTIDARAAAALSLASASIPAIKRAQRGSGL